MPKSKKPVSNLVRVRHVSGAVKYVHPARLRSLSKRWAPVTEPDTTPKRPARKPVDPNPETPADPAPSKED